MSNVSVILTQVSFIRCNWVSLHMHTCTHAHMHTLAHLADSKSVHRVWDKALHVEVEWTVGPIPIDDKKGKEVVLRYASSLHSGQACLLISYASPGFEA